MMRQVMQQTDADLPSMTRRDTVLAAVADSAPVRLTIWSAGGQVQKLEAAPDSGANGPNAGQTDVWFTDGDVAVVQTPTSMHAFDSGRIVLWTDEALVPRTEVASDERMTEETALLELIERWLGEFGLKLP